ncbi:lamin tail domain-containing protein [Haloferula sp. BvORR071]|uniref:lamin tail domain-containing protein n=1 Tax=Haloferula sp. BvORR071 TaxID=1396141 RepID=UPI000695E4FF|nr:lamin tail domain-containing protein [Haloferula sp. BvORR071]
MRVHLPCFRIVCVLLALLLAPVHAVGVYSSSIVISEFLASNGNGLADENGSREDWLEVHNPTPFAVNLDGWYLTDDANNLKKWKFPAVTLPSKGFLVVFASDKNRRNPAAPLHTNFKLSAGGEYLGLIKPDGVTVSWQYAPVFPEQLTNISYGITPIPGPPTTLAGTGSEAQFMIPPAAPPADWIQTGFTPAAGWSSCRSGIGFDDTPIAFGGAKILFVGNLASNGTAPAGDQTVIDRLRNVMGHRVTVVDDNAVVAANAAGMNLVIVSSSVSSSAVNTKLRDVAVPVINWERGLTDDFLLSSAGGAVNLQTDITMTTLGASHVLGAGLPAGPLTVRQNPGTFNVASISNIAPGAKVLATATTGEPAILVVDQGQMLRSNTVAPAVRIETFLGDDGIPPLTPAGVALFDASVVYALGNYTPTNPYDDVYKTNIVGSMKGLGTSALLRIPFVPESVNSFDSLLLRIKYDDGFVAYLNGVEVARRNAPAVVAWDSVATATRTTETGLIAETIDISAYLSLLVAGQPNVLAIQGLNSSLNDVKFLLAPELIAGGEVQPYYQYYTIATPGAVNDNSTLGIVPETTFDIERGYFTEPFNLTLSNEMEEATIRYTTDGSAPTATTGTIYTAPIPISTTTVIRAAGFRSGYSTGKPETRTYLKIADIIHQPASIPGWPQPVVPVGVGSRTHDYEMDPEIVNDPAYTADLIKGMTEIPTMSLVVKQSDMWNSAGGGGFYRNDDLKKPASIEYINPQDPTENVQADCSVEGHSHDRLKRSLRLSFSSAYGESKFESMLFKGSPLFPEAGNTSVDKIILRAGNNHSFARTWNPTRSTYTEDEWYRTTRVAMGGPAEPGRFVHLFINGIYWGLYNPVERPDASFSASEFGGSKEDYFSVNHGGTHDGDSTRFYYTIGELTAKNMAIPENYSELKDYVDIPNFVDYLLCSFYIGMDDWPVNNWWGGNRNNPAGPFYFYNWDGETSWGTGNGSNLTAWVHPLFRATSIDTSAPATRIWNSARVNPDFLMTVADRVHKHLSQGGALSPEQAVARWDILNNHLRNAIIAESARWGDAIQEPPARRDVEWQAEVTRVRNLMLKGTVDGTGTSSNANILRAAMRAQGFYPNIDPPAFSQEGGAVPEGFTLAMSNPNPTGVIYYTLDGSDPRLSGGALNPGALVYGSPVGIGYTLAVKARVLNGSTWSALNERNFVSGSLPPLRVTELMYNPSQPTPDEIAEGFTDNEQFEFIELHNHGDHGINLSGAKFTSGIDFTFGERILHPGESILLVHNPAAFSLRYGSGLNIAGTFEGSLDNTGERIRLKSAEGETLIDFVYDVTWFPTANGGGYSLVAAQPAGDAALWNSAAGWRASSDLGGSPGEEDPPPHTGGGVMTFAQWRELNFSAAELADLTISGPDADRDGDGVLNLCEYAFGTDPQVPSPQRLKIQGELFAARGVPEIDTVGVRRAMFCQRKGGAGVGLIVRPVFSNDLSTWLDAESEPVVIADDGEIEVISVAFPEEGASRYFRVEVTQAP